MIEKNRSPDQAAREHVEGYRTRFRSSQLRYYLTERKK